MGFSRLATFFLLTAVFALHAADNHEDRIRFLMKVGKVDEALTLYEENYLGDNEPDYALLQEMGYLFLEKGVAHPDPKVAAIALYGAAIATHQQATHLLEEALYSHTPEIQMAALHLLSLFPTDEREKQLRSLLHSENLLLRLEAIFLLAEERNEAAIQYTESLMQKLPAPLHILFPSIFARVGTPAAMRSLRRLLVHPNEGVRTAAILSATAGGRDDLLGEIQKMCRSPNVAQQEACAVALGHFCNDETKPYLEKLSRSPHTDVSLLAHAALCSFDHEVSRQHLFREAEKGNLNAIFLLAQVDGSEEVLAPLLDHSNLEVQLNAAIALLQRRDRRCLSFIHDFLLIDVDEIVCITKPSRGGGLRPFRLASSLGDESEGTAFAIEQTLQLREAILSELIDFPEEDFLGMVRSLLSEQIGDLTPCAIHLVEQLATPAAIALLKEQQQRLGSPLIRNYCNLALYRLQEEGDYGDHLRAWVATKQATDLIQFRTLLPYQAGEEEAIHTLTPVETSRLLLEAYETFAKDQNQEGIATIFTGIREGNPANRYALAGLLMRAVQ